MEKPHIVHDPEHWRSRAVEARAIADGLTDPDAKCSMLKIAEEYERLAERAGQRAAERGSLD
jgi:hypothetical protein